MKHSLYRWCRSSFIFQLLLFLPLTSSYQRQPLPRPATISTPPPLDITNASTSLWSTSFFITDAKPWPTHYRPPSSSTIPRQSAAPKLNPEVTSHSLAKFNQEDDDESAYYTNVHLMLKKIYGKIVSSHQADGLVPTETAAPAEDLLQAEESVHSPVAMDTSAEYFINIPPQTIPIRIRFNTKTSTIRTEQNHIVNQGGQIKKLYTVEEPDRLIHLIKKPIIQEVHEVITPYRKRLQLVEPLQERVETKIGSSKDDVTVESETAGSDSEAPKILQSDRSTASPREPLTTATEDLTTDIELDKIIANLIRNSNEDESESNVAGKRKVIFRKNRLGTVAFSKPQTVAPIQRRPENLEPLADDDPATSYRQQLQLYKELIQKLQRIFNIKEDEKDLMLSSDEPPDIRKTYRKFNHSQPVLQHGFIPITTTTPRPQEQLLSSGSSKEEIVEMFNSDKMRQQPRQNVMSFTDGTLWSSLPNDRGYFQRKRNTIRKQQQIK